MRYIIFFLLVSCTTETTKLFNTEDQQWPECYKHYGAMPGYCTK